MFPSLLILKLSPSVVFLFDPPPLLRNHNSTPPYDFVGRIGPEILATHTRLIDPTSSDHPRPSINSCIDSCPDASFLGH